jgi:predicted TIM-barrel enzyme
MRRAAILERLRDELGEGRPIVVAGVGSGLTAQGAAAGGADLLAVYSTAAYRIIGAPTALAFLPYDDANQITLAVAPQVLAAAGDTPVIVGLGAHDPRRPIEGLLDEVEALGGAGATNEPFVGIYGAEMRWQLDAAGVGFSRELELVRRAGARGLLTLGWCFSAADVEEMCDAGADLIGVMAGITRTASGEHGEDGDEEAEALQVFQPMVERARRWRPEALVLLHGGPLNEPGSVERAVSATRADGYVTGSSAERQPVAAAVAASVAAFKRLGGRDRA